MPRRPRAAARAWFFRLGIVRLESLGEIAPDAVDLVTGRLPSRCLGPVAKTGRYCAVLIGQAAAVRWVVDPGISGDLGVVEAIKAADIDVHPVIPPIDPAPDGPAYGHAAREHEGPARPESRADTS